MEKHVTLLSSGQGALQLSLSALTLLYRRREEMQQLFSNREAVQAGRAKELHGVSVALMNRLFLLLATLQHLQVEATPHELLLDRHQRFLELGQPTQAQLQHQAAVLRSLQPLLQGMQQHSEQNSSAEAGNSPNGASSSAAPSSPAAAPSAPLFVNFDLPSPPPALRSDAQNRMFQASEMDGAAEPQRGGGGGITGAPAAHAATAFSSRSGTPVQDAQRAHTHSRTHSRNLGSVHLNPLELVPNRAHSLSGAGFEHPTSAQAKAQQRFSFGSASNDATAAAASSEHYHRAGADSLAAAASAEANADAEASPWAPTAASATYIVDFSLFPSLDTLEPVSYTHLTLPTKRIV